MKAAEQRAEEACRWLATMPEGRATPDELGKVLGWHPARRAEALAVARSAGWVDGRKQLTLLPAGWARFGVVLAQAQGAGRAVQQALEGWPQSHRAFVELAIAAVVGRHHLGEQRPSGHLAFMALGETGTGKSAAAQLVCDLFGWDPAAHTLHTPSETAGSLLGRRRETPEGYAWEPAPATLQPFVFLDELDKADEPTRRRAMVYAHGEVRIQLEGQMHTVRPTAMLAANPPRGGTGDRYAQLRPEYRRRSVVLDTSALRGRGHELGDVLAAYYANQARPRLSLEALRPPAATLSEWGRELLRSLPEILTDAGREEFPPVRALEVAALGWLALLGPDADPDVAAYRVAVAYLQATETVPGQVVAGWQASAADIQRSLGESPGAEDLSAVLERGRQEREEVHRRVRRARTERASVDLATVEQGATLAARLRRLHEALDGRRLGHLTPAQRDQAQGLRRTLRTLADKAARVGTQRALEEVEDQAAGPITRAEQLVAAQVEARARAEREGREARQAEAAARAQVQEDRRRRAEEAKAWAATERTQQAVRRQGLRAALEQVVSAAKPLEALYRRTTTRAGESPLAQLAALRVEGHPVLHWESSVSQRPGESRVLTALAAIAAPGQGAWKVAGTSLEFPGTRQRCEELAQWGQGTRAALAPVLLRLHQVEDELRAQAGLRARGGRPYVDARPAATRQLPAPTNGYRTLPSGRRR